MNSYRRLLAALATVAVVLGGSADVVAQEVPVVIRVGGHVQNDWAFFFADDDIEAVFGSLEDGTEFRRARIFIDGTIYENVGFRVQYDFAGGDADFKDVYITLRDVPTVGTIRVGHQKEPLGLEVITSSKYLTFLERALPAALLPERNTGFQVYNSGAHQRVTWALGVFRNADSFGDASGNGEYNVSGRITGLPIFEDEANLVHVGASFSRQEPTDGILSLHSDPESHLAPDFVDTGDIPVDHVYLVGGEAAWVRGSLSLQGEYVRAFVDRADGTSPSFYGGYAQASFFLTGEHRRYRQSGAYFDRVRPVENFGKDGGAGAWEIAVRYSMLDLTDDGVVGGELSGLTLGLNWYLNPNSRVMLNYSYSDLDGVGKSHIVQTRFQVDF